MDEKIKKLGIIVNPIAGLGGKLALKGSDLEDILEKAEAMGGVPEAPNRMRTALKLIFPLNEKLEVLTYGGNMGEDILKEEGFHNVKVLGFPENNKTTSEDTKKAARLMADEKPDLILFAGGDGTARDIYEAVGEKVPVMGVPAGVKIHSSVYATTPTNAGTAARDYLDGKITHIKESAVMDINEELFRKSIVEAKLYGYMIVPDAGERIQNIKSAIHSEDDDLIGIVDTVMESMEDDIYYIIGPGSTTKILMDELGIEDTLLGIDIIKNKELCMSDVTEKELWELLNKEDIPAKLIVTIIGGQGNLFGRGNQQLSPRVIRKIGIKNIIVIATEHKIAELGGRPLVVDTGDTELDEALSGYIEIITGYNKSAYHKVHN
jgi:predicted polyphosphate/ATP-dependent NAD kinase